MRQDKGDTLHYPKACTSESQALSCFVALFTRLGVFAQHQEENDGRGVGGGGHVGAGGLLLFAFGTQTVQSMQIDKQ